MNELLSLYEKHDNKVSDKWGIYLQEYNRLLSLFKEEEINFLEIGVQNGGSLEIWSKYFKSAKHILGCDINPKCGELIFEDSRIKVTVGDACNISTKNEILNHATKFDVIIEDGSHTSSDIIKTFALYFNNLKDDGVFIFEDLHCSYWQEFEGGLYDPYSSMNFFKTLSDIINYQHWGIERTRSSFLNGFEDKYGIELTGLDEIHSIEFFNSVCVIKKKESDTNLLGKRFIAGGVEDVVKGHLTPDFSLEIPKVCQAENFWSQLDKSPSEQWLDTKQKLEDTNQKLEDVTRQLEDSNQKLEDVTRQLEDSNQKLEDANQKLEDVTRQFEHNVKFLNLVLTSKSWKLTSPLRHSKQSILLVKKSGDYLKENGLRAFSKKIRSKVFDRNNVLQIESDQRGYIYNEQECNDEILKEIKEFIYQPLISIIMPVYNVDVKWLDLAIKSVNRQCYKNWELCLVDDKSTKLETIQYLKALNNPKVKVEFLSENKGISQASNAAIEIARGDYIALMDNDDEITPDALYEVVKVINKSKALIVYSDEDKLDTNGNFFEPYYKSDWNLDLFFSQNYVSNLGVYKTEIIKKIGGFRTSVEGSQDQDLLLRCLPHVTNQQIVHIPKVLYHWRMIEGSTALASGEKSYTTQAGIKALQDYFKENGPKGVTVQQGLVANTYKVNWPIPNNPPKVSLLIPTRDRKQITEVAVRSILEKTTYPNYEIVILDNGSVEPETLTFFKQIQQEDKRVSVLRYDHPFNYSAINNYGVEKTNGELVGLINNDIEVINEDWLTEMVQHAIRPEIGCVGAKLYYPNDLIQHAGVILGIGGVASHGFRNFKRKSNGYFNRLKLIQNYSAVTAACLVVKRKIYTSVLGLDEQNLQVAYNDVDFCLKVINAGYRNLWTPYAELYHYESISRGYEDSPELLKRLFSEAEFMKDKWTDLLNYDPAYNINLTRDADDFTQTSCFTKTMDFEGAVLYEWLDNKESKKEFACMFASYDSKSILHDYVVFYLEALSKYCDIYFVSTAESLFENLDNVERLKKICKSITVKKNEGYDFGSWRYAFEKFEVELTGYKFLLQTNDSIYGPLFPLDKVFQTFMNSDLDVMGLTDSNEINHHIQSYFVMYKNNVFSSKLFERMWRRVAFHTCKWDIIKNYEIGFSQRLLHSLSDYKIGAYCDMSNYPNVNHTHVHWRDLIKKHGFPFIKIELLRDNPANIDISEWESFVSDYSGYPCVLINSHLSYINSSKKQL